MSDNLPLPPLPAPPSGLLVLFSQSQWRWLTDTLTLQYLGQQTTLVAISGLTQTLSDLITAIQELKMTTSDFQGDLDRNTASVNAAVTAMQNEVQQLKDALAQLSTSKPPTQAQLDQLNSSTSKLDQATAILISDDPKPTPPTA